MLIPWGRVFLMGEVLLYRMQYSRVLHHAGIKPTRASFGSDGTHIPPKRFQAADARRAGVILLRAGEKLRCRGLAAAFSRWAYEVCVRENVCVCVCV
jgi:hypothetical protein